MKRQKRQKLAGQARQQVVEPDMGIFLVKSIFWGSYQVDINGETDQDDLIFDTSPAGSVRVRP